MIAQMRKSFQLALKSLILKFKQYPAKAPECQQWTSCVLARLDAGYPWPGRKRLTSTFTSTLFSGTLFIGFSTDDSRPVSPTLTNHEPCGMTETIPHLGDALCMHVGKVSEARALNLRDL
jgi:hypothetical protein